MSTIQYRWLGLIVLSGGVLGWLANLVTIRGSLPVPVLHLSSLVTMAAVVAFTLALGLRVRRWRNGKRDRELNPVLAARTLVLAQACAYAGALIIGWHAGILLDQLALLAFRPGGPVLWQVLAMMGAGLVMVVTGLVVERFCKLPPEDPNALKEATDEGPEPAGEGEYA
ncbi:DUF3180 domain-containing protein [Arthrobacter mobilis]|uniref:DUF3180 domain-containing protein n=1 Tax=Arthrobacter mobilis TaxID=2724944 RepID=A0A7X6K6J1_9MICC|nr:DUF3180 domain-containing protein [Arthrobacter mobilis]NKX55088.1 DUF3180 domain-containing protein [Arthrobacter mobilis]